jgi:hypothetical protein
MNTYFMQNHDFRTRQLFRADIPLLLEAAGLPGRPRVRPNPSSP